MRPGRKRLKEEDEEEVGEEELGLITFLIFAGFGPTDQLTGRPTDTPSYDGSTLYRVLRFQMISSKLCHFCSLYLIILVVISLNSPFQTIFKTDLTIYKKQQNHGQ